MKLKAIIVSTLLLCCLSTIIMYAMTEETTTTSSIAAKAIQRGDTPQLIKALIGSMKEQMDVDEDKFPELIGEVERYAANCSDTASAAVLHSMVAEMYNHYYTSHRRKIDNRHDIAGYTPEDIREWTTGLFTQKIQEELAASLHESRLLRNTSARTFRAIMETGKDAPSLRPSLYDFLAFRALDIAPSAKLYQQVISHLNTLPDKKAAALTTLDYLKFLYADASSEKSRKEYAASLDSLLNIYADKDYSVEILDAKLSDGLYGFSFPGDTREMAACYEACSSAVARFPHYERIGLIANRLAEMQNPMLQVSTAATVYPGKMLTLKLSYRNIKQLTLRIYNSRMTPTETLSYSNENKAHARGELAREEKFTLNIPNTYTTADTTLTIATEGPGLYEYIVSSTGSNIKSSGLFQVSRLAGISRSLTGGKTEVLVTDYLSGKPITDATIEYYSGKSREMKSQGTVQTDKNGIAAFTHKDGRMAYRVSIPGDEQVMLTQVYSSEQQRAKQSEKPKLALFTDRELYRPGQTLRFKGIAYKAMTDSSQVLEDETFEVRLRDSGGNVVASQSCRTNRFGSFSGEFLLPETTLNGTFTLSSDYAGTRIRVEEYKRPTFRVDILPLKGEISFGDTATICGKVATFSGTPLQNGTVTYRITRQPWLLRGFSAGSRAYEQVSEGETSVSSDGSFSFSFIPQKDERKDYAYQAYLISVMLTDSNGETQEETSSVTVGESSIILTGNLPECAVRESVCMTISAKTLNSNETITTNGRYTIHQLNDKATSSEKEDDNNDSYETGRVMATGCFTSGKEIDPAVLRNLPSGRYRISFEAADSKGRLATGEQCFILYGLHDKKPPINTHVWLPNEKVCCQAGEEAEVTFGTSDKDAYVLYELFHDGICVSRERIVMSNENRLFRIPFKEDYGDGIVATFTFVKDGELHKAQTEIQRRQPDRKLTIVPTTFRNHLLPGGKETWTFRIQDADSAAVTAELLASMYDVSLDQILPGGAREWNLSPWRTIYLHAPTFSSGAGMGNRSSYDAGEPRFTDVPEYQYDQLNWQGVMEGSRQQQRFGQGLMLKSMAATAMPEAEGANTADNSNQPETQIRKDFSETAFFYPSLQTDNRGDVTLQFTLPESNTTWELQALAHTTDMKCGLLTREVVSSKPLMVSPNLPRFMREGDEVTISTQVINHSQATISGEVRLELFNAATNQPLGNLSQQPFMLSANSMTTASWTFHAPSVTGLVGCRIVAESESGCDGEQHLIPILSNQILITESTPIFLTDTTQQTIRLSATGNRHPHQTTIELTANPVWYAIQALPVLSQPTYDDVVSWFASYYSNTLANHIATANPRIQQVISQWKAEGETSATLYSNLEKNTELKNILLEETPWALAAKDETEQKRHLSLLFDTNRANEQRKTALRRLTELQTEEGGWSWFKGFPTSRSLTLYILKGMSQLSEMNAVTYTDEEKEMQVKALHYLDNQIQSDYEHLKKNDKKWRNSWPNASQMEYLFVRSSYDDTPDTEGVREAIRFYTTQAEKNWHKQSIHEKSETALLMYRCGKKNVANNILAWLRKTATTSTKQGMYWANNRREIGNYFTSPIETHCLLMSVFNALSPRTKETELMKQWLLNQKRTQQWESSPTTLNAIYALIQTGSDWVSEDNHCVVTVGNNSYTTADGETATGYIKVVMDESNTSSNTDTISFFKEGNAPAWGSVYQQFFENINEVTKQKGALSIEKKLFVEDGSGQKITPVESGKLRIGDKVIVRLTIRSDQEMDYVCVKDLRAGCFEPKSQISETKFRDGVVYYQSPTDVSENFFFNRLPKGTFVIEYPVYVSRSGEYTGGISNIQCLYAPEFVSHTEGSGVSVDN